MVKFQNINSFLWNQSVEAVNIPKYLDIFEILPVEQINWAEKYYSRNDHGINRRIEDLFLIVIKF